MTLHVNIPLSNDIYKKAQTMAQQFDKEVPEFLADYLAEALGASVDSVKTAPEKEQAAYHTLHPTLLEKFSGRYVAIYKGELIDHDEDQLALVGRLDESHPDQFVLVRQVQPDPEPEYRRIAIRWAD